MNKYSSLRRLRNKNNCKSGYLSVDELKYAITFWIKAAQTFAFSKEINQIKVNKGIDNKLLNLEPFLDDNEVLRVGGRLRQSDLPFQVKLPIILSSDTKLTKLIVMDVHY